jgi:N-methylhydantoinase A
MERAIRRVSVERGHDPRDYALIAFGGAAGQHACELAGALGIARVVIPLHPGLLSAWGAATADVQRDHVRTVRLTNPSSALLRRVLQPLERRARAELHSEQVRKADLRILSTLDVRYQGQSHEVSIPYGADFASAFHAAHQRLYGYADQARPIEVVNVRVLAIGRTTRRHTVGRAKVERQAPVRHRVRDGGRWQTARVWSRPSLLAGRVVRGPAVVEEFSATTFVPRDWQVVVHPMGHLILERR